MKDQVLKKCELFAINNRKVSKAFAWEFDYMSMSAASFYAANGLEVDIDKLKECEKILIKETNAFSDFRGMVKLPVLCKMAMSEDPVGYLNKLMDIYNVLNRRKFAGNEYRIMAALVILDRVGNDSYEKYIDRTNELYSRMSKNHPFLTGYEDIPFAAMLAVSDLSIDRMIDDMEDSYKLLKGTFGDPDALQSLSHVLALENSAAEVKCEKVKAIYNGLKSAKHKYGQGYELPSLGALALLDAPVDEIIDIICSADDYLKKQKGFSVLSVGATERRMFASQLLISEYVNYSNVVNNAVMNSLLAISIMIEMCLMISIITATNAATT